MNTTKKINVNVSSLVGLKAELLRKHTEVRDAKAKININKSTLPEIKDKVKNKKIKNEEKNVTKNITEIEDVNTLKKSKYMLIAKSKLYDKLMKNREEFNDNYLVDFKNKNYESSDDNESFQEENNWEDTNIDPDEDWIDYKDCFGRTRKCLRKDLPKMKEKDSLIEREITKIPHNVEKEVCNQSPAYTQPEKEPEIEIMRKKWEEQTEKLAHKSDIHYQDILFDEARAHGVGYFAFSHDEDERIKQQANLFKLRKETEQKQKELLEIKNLKNKMEENRLKTARTRARVRAGLPPEPTEDEIQNESTKIAPNPSEEIPEIESPEKEKSKTDNEKSNDASNNEDSLIVIENKIKAFGELLGKRLPWRELSQEEWVHKRRKDRKGEFAPVYENFKPGETLTGTKNNQLATQMTIIKDSDDPLQIHADGPEPTDMWESSGPRHSQDNDNIAESSNSPEKIQLPEQPNISPLLNPTIPPSTIVGVDISSQLPISAINSFNSCSIPPPRTFYPVSKPSFTNYMPPGSVYSSSLPYLSNLPQMSSSKPMDNTTNQPSMKDTSTDDSESDDSDIIGPMPPPSASVKDDDILAQIPLPDQPPPDLYKSANSNADKIAAGLRYLRQKFETNKNN